MKNPTPCLLLLATCLAAQEATGVYPAAKTGGNYMHSYYIPPTGNGSPWWPAWSPDGQWIAFSMHGSIWRMRPSDTTAEEFVSAPEYLSSPEWSPDGLWLVYTADNGGQSINLMLKNLRTGEVTALTSGNHVILDPAWSPDGKRLAYVSTAPNGYFNVYVMELGAERRVTAVTTDHRYGRDRLYFGDYDVHLSPTW